MSSNSVKAGEIITCKVFKITNFGAFVKLPNNQRGLIHISQISENYVKDINEHIKLGEEVEARVVSVNNGRIDLTLKQEKKKERATSSYSGGREFKSSTLEEQLNQFMQK